MIRCCFKTRNGISQLKIEKLMAAPWGCCKHNINMSSFDMISKFGFVNLRVKPKNGGIQKRHEHQNPLFRAIGR